MKPPNRENRSRPDLRILPPLQDVLNHPSITASGIDHKYLKIITDRHIEKFRSLLLRNAYAGRQSRSSLLKDIVQSCLQEIRDLSDYHLRRVINGTGIILHTNLGRAPLAATARKHLVQVTENYCNLEFDLDSGKRGERNALVEDIIRLITGAEDAVVVNNNAAAVLLVLNSLCRRKEVPVSRGELVEIGGSFRMPEVMKAGLVKMVEVGTTNKTHLKDYEEALNSRTGAILKVHTSNYRVMGFTEAVSVNDLVNLARKHAIPLIYDMGSGVIEDIEQWGYPHEPVACKYVETGVDVITFSADKVLGAAQAGIIIGKEKYLRIIKRNHLLRALRCDKLTYAVLDTTLRLYLKPAFLTENLPVAGILRISRAELRRRGNELVKQLKGLPLRMKVKDSFSQMGSGALPLEKIPSIAVEFIPQDMSVNRFARLLRQCKAAIIGYIEQDAFLLNLRTIREDEINLIAKSIRGIWKL
jgi:L-seryl-tRNA(Ser) seleniumtransferase